MKLEILAARGCRMLVALGLAGAVSACASSTPPRQQVYAPAPPPAAAPPRQQTYARPPAPQQPSYARPPAPLQQPQAQARPPQPQAQARPPQPPRAAPPQAPSVQQVAIGGTAFPTDGTQGRVPDGSRMVVRVYDAAGGDVNVRVAESAFNVSQGLPARYKVPVPAQAMNTMDLPAVAARVEGPRGRVIYRNETAVLLEDGAAGDIPMTRQGKQAASAVTREWTAPTVE